jgi:hypothetical protein
LGLGLLSSSHVSGLQKQWNRRVTSLAEWFFSSPTSTHWLRQFTWSSPKSIWEGKGCYEIPKGNIGPMWFLGDCYRDSLPQELRA